MKISQKIMFDFSVLWKYIVSIFVLVGITFIWRGLYVYFIPNEINLEKFICEESQENCMPESSMEEKNAQEKICEERESQQIEEIFELKPGATLTSALLKFGFSKKDVCKVVHALSKNFKLQLLKAGSEINISYKKDPSFKGQPKIHTLSFSPDLSFSLKVTRNESGCYICEKILHKLESRYVHVQGKIKKSIYGDILGYGADPVVVKTAIKVLSHDINFQKDISPGDKFELLYKEKFNPENGTSCVEKVLFVALKLRHKICRLYRYQPFGNANAFFYDERGKCNKTEFLKTPINGARVSSRFGMRLHPVHGNMRMHKGVDLTAKRGTSIVAAANGVIEKACCYKGYGNYILIRHSDGYKTSYAHLNCYAKSIKAGQSVRQGQKIGSVGNTGCTTGAHLHFEVIHNGKAVNPLGFKQLPMGQFSKRDSVHFRNHIEKIHQKLEKTPVQNVLQ